MRWLKRIMTVQKLYLTHRLPQSSSLKRAQEVLNMHKNGATESSIDI